MKNNDDGVVYEGTVMIQDNTIVISGPITDNVAGQFCVAMSGLEGLGSKVLSKKGVVVKIISPGGSTDSGWAIYDSIRCSPLKVTTVGLGEVSSMGAIIFLAGDERIIAPRARLMIHDVSVENLGNGPPNILKRRVRECEIHQKEVLTTIASRTGQWVKWVEGACKLESYLGAEECVKFGFAHKILKEKK